MADRIFIDFDNTITKSDVVFDIIKKFSIDEEWIEIEENWCQSQISAKECLIGQLQKVKVTQPALEKYLTKVKLDEGFYGFLSFLRKECIEPVILSDNFKPIIEFILNFHEIKGIKVYANNLLFYNDRLFPSFPFSNPDCPSCAHCKKTHILPEKLENKFIVYIGDGRSDFCPAIVSDMVFAKETLAEYLRPLGRDFIPYSNLGEVSQYLKDQLYLIRS